MVVIPLDFLIDASSIAVHKMLLHDVCQFYLIFLLSLTIRTSNQKRGTFLPHMTDYPLDDILVLCPHGCTSPDEGTVLDYVRFGRCRCLCKFRSFGYQQCVSYPIN